MSSVMRAARTLLDKVLASPLLLVLVVAVAYMAYARHARHERSECRGVAAYEGYGSADMKKFLSGSTDYEAASKVRSIREAVQRITGLPHYNSWARCHYFKVNNDNGRYLTCRRDQTKWRKGYRKFIKSVLQQDDRMKARKAQAIDQAYRDSQYSDNLKAKKDAYNKAKAAAQARLERQNAPWDSNALYG